MAAWDYLALTITGHNALYPVAKNLVVASSDGRHDQPKVDKADLPRVLTKLGDEGWEMTGTWSECGGTGATQAVYVWFKRPR